MSNTRHIDLAKLAAVLRGQLPADIRPVPPQSPRRREGSFPRVSAERINELLDDEDDAGWQHGGSGGGQLRFHAMLDAPADAAVHYHGRPVA